MNPAEERARHYMGQGRFEEALHELAQASSQDPNDPELYGLRAICLANLSRGKEALEQAQRAIALAPDYGWSHYVHAITLSHLDRDKEAEAAARKAVELDPEEPAYYAALSGALAAQARWKSSLDYAMKGLELDPEHEYLQHLRTQALAFSGKKKEASESARKALEENPDSPEAHAALGWVSLRNNNRGDAIKHFREALRLDPTEEEAQAGLLEALRSAFPPYRYMLAVTHALARLPKQAQTVVFIGLYILYRVLRNVLVTNKQLWPILLPVVVLLGLYFLMTWYGELVTNTILLFHPLGRLALGPARRTQAILFSSVLGLAVVLGIFSAVTPFKMWGGVVVAILTAWLLGLTYNFVRKEDTRTAVFWGVSISGAILALIVGAISMGAF